MYGLMFEILEQWITENHGREVWQAIKEQAKVKDADFFRRSYYSDQYFFDLVDSACNQLHIRFEDMFTLFGHFVVRHHIENGYDDLLQCQGITLRQWLSNLNAMHDHLETTFPGEGYQAPLFWCEDCDTEEGAVLLHYYSLRGVYFVPLVVGMLKEYATCHFEVEINMHPLALQDQDESTQFTTWRISAVDESQTWKLSPKARARHEMLGGTATKALVNGGCPFEEVSMNGLKKSEPQRFESAIKSITANIDLDERSGACPFHAESGEAPSSTILHSNHGCPFASKIFSKNDLHAKQPSPAGENAIMTKHQANPTEHSTDYQSNTEQLSQDHRSIGTKLPNADQGSMQQSPSEAANEYFVARNNIDSEAMCLHNPKFMIAPMTSRRCPFTGQELSQREGLSLYRMQEVFPFHVLVDRNFSIVQVGKSLPGLLDRNVQDFHGKHIQNFLTISRPVLGSSWNWKALQKLEDQHFFLVPTIVPISTADSSTASQKLQRKVSTVDDEVRFKASMVSISSTFIMFALNPDVRNVGDLMKMGLTMSDLPLMSSQRDTVYLGEYITQEVDKAHKLDVLSKKLTVEKNLSNTLLYNMLPKQVANDLRSGKTVEPKLYENVTLFFSDIQGFTSICDQVDPWEVVDMLNQLYSVMDHLAEHFNLYKVETIGDAYMCCSGLPEPDEYHAENVANFALAVVECVKHIKSPADGSPLQLRIGIHTGSCTAGVVGTLTPHYCLFGDMVNTTARHESSGLAGKIQCSSLLYGRLKHFSAYDRVGGDDDSESFEGPNPAKAGPVAYYNFTPRGLVDMKGKGDCYTYWLDSGTMHNHAASPSMIQELSSYAIDILAKKKWKKRRYFRRSGALRDETMSESGRTDSTRKSSESGHSDKSNKANEDKDIDDDVEEEVNDSSLSNDENCAYGISDDDRQEVHQLAYQIEQEQQGIPGHQDSPSCCNDGQADHSNQAVDDIDDYIDSLSEQQSANNHAYSPHEIQNCPWSQLCWDSKDQLTTEDLTTKIYDLLLASWNECMSIASLPNEDASEELVKHQMFGFVHQITNVYNRSDGARHCSRFKYISHVVLCADYLWGQVDYQLTSLQRPTDPWNRLIVVFAALVYDIQGGDGSASNDEALRILEDDFPDLYHQIVFSCPRFLLLVRKAVLATTSIVANYDATTTAKQQKKHAQAFDNAMCNSGVGNRDVLQRVTASMECVLALASIAHYTQDYDTVFLRWNDHLQLQPRNKSESDKECVPMKVCYVRNKQVFDDIVIPLIDLFERLVPQSSVNIRGAAKTNKSRWEDSGQHWINRFIPRETDTTTTLADSTQPPPESSISALNDKCDDSHIFGQTVVCRSLQEIVDGHVEILSAYMQKILVGRTNARGRAPNPKATRILKAQQHRSTIPMDDVKTVITMQQDLTKPRQQPGEDTAAHRSAESLALPQQVQSELRDYVSTIASGYKLNAFHNFEHASHVVRSTDRFLQRIQLAASFPNDDNNNDDRDYIDWISNDTLAAFAMIFSALIHDVGHTGVPNGQLAKESPDIAKKYAKTSIAEQRSVDAAWNLLMQGRYTNLQKCLFTTPAELDRFRQLVVNCVMATDIFDPESKQRRNSRWNAAFPCKETEEPDAPDAGGNCVHYKGTLVMEHIIQASDVAHTMQDWLTYRTWNEKLFMEMYGAYLQGRAVKNPLDGWYKGELWFFDNWVIPLAKRLKECGATGVFSDDYLDFAVHNRKEWEVKGGQICKSMMQRANKQYGINRRGSSRSEKGEQSCLRSINEALSPVEKQVLKLCRRDYLTGSLLHSSHAESKLTTCMIREVDRLAKFRNAYEKKMRVACKTLVTVATKEDGEATLKRHRTISGLHRFLRRQDWYKSHSDEGWSSDNGEDFEHDADHDQSVKWRNVATTLQKSCSELENGPLEFESAIN